MLTTIRWKTTIIKKLLYKDTTTIRRRTESMTYIYIFNLTMKEVIQTRINSKENFYKTISLNVFVPLSKYVIVLF